VTPSQELIDDTVDCRRGNGEHAATWSEHGHAEYASLHIDESTAFRGPAEHQIKMDEAVDATAAKTPPRSSRDGDDAETGDWCTLPTADCHDDITRAKRLRVDGLGCRQSVRLETEHCDVGAGVPTRERCLDQAPTRKRNLDVLVLIENLFGRDDDPGTPMDAACGQSATAMHTDDAACGTLDELCGMIRKGDERIGGFGHEQALRYGARPGYGIVAWSLLLAR
jgi:hypothetical protein